MTVPMRTRCRLPRAGAAAATRERGMVLFIALIVLVAMTLAGVALERSVDTSNLIAGNLAFKQSTLLAADLGIEVGASVLPNISVNSIDTDLTPAASSTNPNYWYYATRRQTDANGVPTQKQFIAGGTATAINWTQVPVAQTISGNSVQIVIDRLCNGPTPVTDLAGNCFSDPAALGSGSYKSGGTNFTGVPPVYYRVTARIAGPRNTVSMVQAILNR